tara:strand:+ start:4522 stop:4698 length:177 start_codon:yes stop_codon:yes gene_type:complete
MKKEAIVQFKGIVLSQNSKLIEVQKLMLLDNNYGESFKALNDFIVENLDLYTELEKLS